MERLLDDAKRMILAWPGRTVPLLTPMAFWWDGQHVWFSTAGDSEKARALQRNPSCAMYVAPPREGLDGILLRGEARVFHLGDPLGLTVHAGFLAAAQTALMVKNAPSMLGYVVDAGRIPQRYLPVNRVLVRVTTTSCEPISPPPLDRGIAPALPPEVPPEIRRKLAGQRHIALATQVDGGIGLLPAVWGTGFSLSLPAGMGLVEGMTATAVLDHDPAFRPTEVAGVSLSGTIRSAGPLPALSPTRVRWWDGFRMDAAEIAPDRDAVVLPD